MRLLLNFLDFHKKHVLQDTFQIHPHRRIYFFQPPLLALTPIQVVSLPLIRILFQSQLLLPIKMKYFFALFSYDNKFCILFRPIPKVDVLWSNAEVVGCMTPPTPNKIRTVLNPTINL